MCTGSSSSSSSTGRKSHIGPRAHTVRTHRASLVSGHFSQLTASCDEARMGFTFLPPRIVRVDPTRVASTTRDGFHGSERILDRRRARLQSCKSRTTDFSLHVRMTYERIAREIGREISRNAEKRRRVLFVIVLPRDCGG